MVLSCSWSPLKILAIPNSEIFRFISASRRALLVFRSLCIILSLESWWRYGIPWATPLVISKHFFQSNKDFFLWSASRREVWFLCNHYVVYFSTNFKYMLHYFWTYQKGGALPTNPSFVPHLILYFDILQFIQLNGWKLREMCGSKKEVWIGNCLRANILSSPLYNSLKVFTRFMCWSFAINATSFLNSSPVMISYSEHGYNKNRRCEKP